ncbi:MAG TPA: PaaI family thioesterase [Solirubrobacteraceae bacterium]|jgi:uncharacterized protein (TIGR00369 family)
MSDQAAPAAEAIEGSPWREPVRGGYLDPAGLARPGSEQMRAMLEGRSPQPPLSRLTGLRLIAVGDGAATFELPITEWLCSAQGTISLGPLTIPADAAIACAIISLLPAETGPTTAELSLRMLHTVRPGDTVTARARVIDLGSTVSFAEAAVTDGDGRLVAHATSLCVLLSLPARAAAQPPHHEEPAEIPDPWRRSAIGAAVPASAWDRLSGLEVLREQIAGKLPLPPVHHLTGMTLVSADAGTTTLNLPATEWLCAPPPGRVQGGAVAVLAEAAITGAIQTTLPAGVMPGPIDLKVNYLRPLAATGDVAVATGTIVHAGRRLAVANAQVNDSTGKPVAVATGSAILQAGGMLAPSPDRRAPE